MTREIVGRATELASVRDLVDEARAGRGGVLLVVGDAGIGKSVLLDAAVSVAVESQSEVLRVVGVEAERDLPFAGLSALVTPLLEHRDSLTATQQSALDVAIGLTDGPPPGRMVLGGVLLALLSARAERQPVVVVVDDLQWVDRPSAETITFAARRLQAERVAALIASRPAEGVDPDGLGPLLRSMPALTMTGLPLSECHRLIPSMASEVTVALAERTGGNPLAMIEAAALLDADVRSGKRRLPGHVPPTSAAETYRRMLSSLPPAAREGCRLLAYAGRAPGDVVVEALAKLSISLADLEPFERTGLGRLTMDHIEWRHPLARSAAAEGTADQVRRIHAVLAECWVSVPGSRPQWAWHMAEAVSGPDQEVAEALADIAAMSAGRAASLEAADAWERAANLTERPHQRHQWLGMAAHAAFRGGAAVRAARLYDLALQTPPGEPDDERRAVLLHERGRVEHALGRPSHAYSLLMDAARTGAGRRQVWAAAEAVLAAMYARRPDLAGVAASVAVAAHDPDDHVQRFLADHAEGAAASLAGDQATAHDRLTSAQALLLQERLIDEEPGLLLEAVNADLFLDGPVPALPAYVGGAVARMRETGELMWSPRVVRLVGVRDYVRGAWGRAYAAFEEATELSRFSGQRTQVAEGLLLQAAVEAARGQRDLCWEHTEEAAEIVKDLEVSWLADGVWETRGLLHLTLDEPQSAADCYGRCLDAEPDAMAGLVEAMIRSGRAAEAHEVLNAHPGDVTGASMSVAQCLVDNDPAAARRLLQHADGAPGLFDAARWRYAAGAMLRRSGARREAREQLRLAETVFQELGAAPWVDRVRSELQASGATLRSEPEAQLTPGELRVATLVAEGRSNKEVAAALFLSTKTVEFHLSRAFRKLGVASRTALAARLGERVLTDRARTGSGQAI